MLLLTASVTRAEEIIKRKCLPSGIASLGRKRGGQESQAEEAKQLAYYRPRAVARRSERIGETLSTSQGVEISHEELGLKLVKLVIQLVAT
jgi:hypothetical protein